MLSILAWSLFLTVGLWLIFVGVMFLKKHREDIRREHPILYHVLWLAVVVALLFAWRAEHQRRVEVEQGLSRAKWLLGYSQDVVFFGEHPLHDR